MLRLAFLLLSCYIVVGNAQTQYYSLFWSNVNNLTIALGQSNMNLPLSQSFGAQKAYSNIILGVGGSWDFLMYGQVGYSITLGNIGNNLCKYTIIVGKYIDVGQSACNPFVYEYKNGPVSETITISS